MDDIADFLAELQSVHPEPETITWTVLRAANGFLHTSSECAPVNAPTHTIAVSELLNTEERCPYCLIPALDGGPVHWVLVRHISQALTLLSGRGDPEEIVEVAWQGAHPLLVPATFRRLIHQHLQPREHIGGTITALTTGDIHFSARLGRSSSAIKQLQRACTEQLVYLSPMLKLWVVAQPEPSRFGGHILGPVDRRQDLAGALEVLGVLCDDSYQGTRPYSRVSELWDLAQALGT